MANVIRYRIVSRPKGMPDFHHEQRVRMFVQSAAVALIPLRPFNTTSPYLKLVGIAGLVRFRIYLASRSTNGDALTN